MKDIKLSEYQNTSIYFYLFDVVIKNKNLNKDEFLISIGISPTSYRRARKSEQAIGHEIIKILADYFNYRFLTNEEISNMEILFTNIYNDMYYKCFDNYDSYMNTLDHEIATNSILFPILYNFKSFMMLNKILKPEEEKKAFDIYKENKCYSNFFSFDLKIIFKIFEAVCSSNFPEYYSTNDLDDGLIFYVIASKNMQNEEYLKTIYYANIAKKCFLEYNNFNRAYYVNLILMTAYSGVLDFEKSYNLAKSQIISLRALGNENDIYNTTYGHYLVGCLGLKKFSELLRLIGDKEILRRTEAYCKLVALYMLKETEYEESINELLSKVDMNERETLKALDLYLKEHDDKALKIIENSGLKMNFHNALKIIFN